MQINQLFVNAECESVSSHVSLDISIHFTNVEFRKAEPQKYRLLQAADFICRNFCWVLFWLFEFDRFKAESGDNAFTLTPQQWIKATDALGVISKSGRYGGTITIDDKDILHVLAYYRIKREDAEKAMKNN